MTENFGSFCKYNFTCNLITNVRCNNTTISSVMKRKRSHNIIRLFQFLNLTH